MRKIKKEKGSSLEPKSILFNLTPNSIKHSSNYPLSHNIKFLLDTGASCHIVNKKSYFHKYFDTTNETVKVVNGEKVPINGYGNILWKTNDIHGKTITVTINNVKLITTLT